MRQLKVSGLLIFSTFAELQNSRKPAKSHKIHKKHTNYCGVHKKSYQIKSIQHIWNLSQLLGLSDCLKLANLSWNFITTMSKQLPRHKLCCEKLGTCHDVKSFAIGSFLEHFVVKIGKWLSLLKTLNTLVKSAQNRSVSSEICPESSHNIGHFLPIVFRQS